MILGPRLTSPFAAFNLAAHLDNQEGLVHRVNGLSLLGTGVLFVWLAG